MEAWNIIGTIANSIAALGTLGAVIVAVIVYRRQVEDQRRKQSSYVTVMLVDWIEDDNLVADQLKLTLANDSDKPIYQLRAVAGDGRRWHEMPGFARDVATAGQFVIFPPIAKTPTRHYAVEFLDGSFVRWRRRPTGELDEV